MTILLPWPPSELSNPPEGVEFEVWDGTGDVPSPEKVTLFVQPYSFAPEMSATIDRMSALEVIQVQTAGVEHVAPLVPSGVTLCNARGVHDASTAELALTLTLASQRSIPAFVRAQDAQHWEQGGRPSLADRTVMILGYGSIGAAIAHRLEGFEVEVLRVASTPRDGVYGVEDLPELLPRAEVVIVVVPLTDATRGLVDADFLAQLPDDALVVNVARGGVVDTDALVVELDSGRLRAALDVTEPEPLPPDHPLWRAPGVLITPHVGGATTAMKPRIRKLVGEQVHRYTAGDPLLNVVIEGRR